jgi:uncharacterized repeat protein (TIGR01451 family)
MAYVDIDGNGTTFDSSAATLSLPSNSTVLFAGLYWGAKNNSSQPPQDNNLRGQVLLATPSNPSYTRLFADQVDNISSISNGYTYYSAFKNITSLVASGGNGTYTVANIQAARGDDAPPGQFGGWTLVIAYKNAAQNTRNMVVYDGFIDVDFNQTVNQNVSGFQTPQSGPVDTKIGFTVFDGDPNQTNDNFKINGVNLSDALHPVNNFFQGNITDLGSYVTAKNPNYQNNLGFEFARVNASSYFTNNQTSATLTFSTGSERFAVPLLTFSTTLYTADVVPVKTVSNITAPSPNTQYFAGDVVQYTIVATNNGTDFGDNTRITDVLPSNVTYLPGTLRIAGVLKTDAAGDDQAEYNLGTNTITYRIGTGATSSLGGTLITTQSVTVTYQVTINAVGGGTVISNTADTTSTTRSLGFTTTNTSAAANLTVTATPTFTVSSPSIVEGNSGTSNLTFTVTMSAAAGRNMTIYYQTQNNTALVSDSDYNALSATALVYTAGQTSKTVSVVINGDLKYELNETLFLNLSNTPGGAGRCTRHWYNY